MGRGPHTVPLRALLRHVGVGSSRGRDPRGSRSSRIPPPRVAVPSGGGGVPSAPGGRRAAPVAPWCGGVRGGGGWGGRPSVPPAGSGVSSPSVAPGVPPRGILVSWGLPGGRGRLARSGRPPTGQCGGGGGSDKAAPCAPFWASPVRCRLAAGRACGRRPQLWRPRTLGAAASSGGCGAAVSSVWLCPLLGLSGRGGEILGGPLAPWRRLLTAGEGGGMAVPAPGASHRLGGRALSPPPST